MSHEALRFLLDAVQELEKGGNEDRFFYYRNYYLFDNQNSARDSDIRYALMYDAILTFAIIAERANWDGMAAHRRELFVENIGESLRGLRRAKQQLSLIHI